ncbi:decaprenyl-phosphate phosphoribosyltransferase [Anaerophilus nitritogenes]|uniref:decaprenyl-phosphate phosphoribosyltransferase n=1 Tax=Anaerophilus nitritogenes TaxID=2498136 RepID=UPI00101C879F|nr:decaprenyl-phosphate phosphoribosyltransferase [Anaerophilus nitritogenes]
MNIVGLIKTMRPKQWTKNLILFAAVLFSNHLFDFRFLKLSIVGFFLFCIFSGSVYIVNDLVDREKDKIHPKKCMRPIASGKVSTKEAIAFLIVTLLGAFYIAYKINFVFFIIGLFYFSWVTFYSFVLKHIVILDVMSISLGFVLRALAGVVLIDVRISPWLLLCTFLLSLFLALHKRKSEMDLIGRGHKTSRKILLEYTPELLSDMLNIVTSSTVMAYSLYTFSASGSMYMMGTIPFVIYGIFRYQYIVHKKGMGENPELVLLSDLPLIINIILWAISCIFILYFI